MQKRLLSSLASARPRRPLQDRGRALVDAVFHVRRCSITPQGVSYGGEAVASDAARATSGEYQSMPNGSASPSHSRTLRSWDRKLLQGLASLDEPAGISQQLTSGGLHDLASPSELGGAIDAMMTAAGAERAEFSGELVLELSAFERLCLNLLSFQLAKCEVHEIFKSLDGDNDGIISSADILQQCISGRHRVLLCSMLHVFQVQELNKDYELPDNYDFTKPTNDPDSNHGSRTRLNTGRFKEVREQLDFSYHGGYTEARQRWQDTVVSTMMLRTEPKAMPWLVYTCGGYGTGKGFCMAWMSEHGLFPLTDMVCVDPDQFKQTMPEWKHYLQLGRDAGTLCHAESAYMEELVQAVAMRNRQNIWIDGSLWNTDWYRAVFLDLKERYPYYRIAIFYIFASEARARARIEARRNTTGRGIPDEALARSHEGARRSVAELTPYVDFVARIDNDGEVPILRSVEVVDRSGSWETVARRFAAELPRQEDFPLALAPLCLRQIPSPAVQAMAHISKEQKLSLNLKALWARADPEVLPRPMARLLRAHLPGTVMLDSSAAFPVSGDCDMLRMTNVPLGTKVDSCYVYQRQTADESDPLRTRDFMRSSAYYAPEGFPAIIELLKYGGFVYIDTDTGKVIAASCISKRPGTGMLPFGPREPLADGPYEELFRQERWRPVTLGRLQAAPRYAWICPREVIAGQQLGGPYGAFAYELEDGTAWLFQVTPPTATPARRKAWRFSE
mmetsp:Transcript_13966/g.39908  ORF Transcript_13966/g.39908 Transcript_13966/m.39908 type:complete len:733 (-) Transcript_13966:262-2460(-)